MDKIKIIEAANELGLGGTEHVIQLYSKFLNKEYFEVLVVGVRAGGERVKLIQAMGVEVVILNGDLSKLSQLIWDTDVFHWHGDGTLNPEIFNIVRENRPKLVLQTNVFGAFSNSPLYDVIDYDLYVSKMILIRRMWYDQNLKYNFASKRKILHNPVDTDYMTNMFPATEKLHEFKQRNNLQSSFVVGRIGRADHTKFDFITLDGFASFATKVDHARFLLVGTTPKMLAYAQQLNISDKLIIFDTTPDFETLIMYYKMIDIFLAASEIGESFGLVIAEAMTAGLPVITISTPYKDNAQIELVDNGLTGLVVERSAENIASALFYLYHNEKTRKEFSAAAQQKIKREYEAKHIVKSFENLIFQHLSRPVRNPEETLIKDFSMEIAIDYSKRCANLWESKC